ncbi:alkane 1-monooxygenase [Niveibacterium microcysteis]|uniref:Alkane 1-monooxygenase n=1 Tax=Niveibacterium microcysteis TaxID=2811415 RepID=A0ABX7M770_9RHOO|nr:alkane 1-monooxygenase [Niveibacterium microcysteis]QSI77381.1 alkane 1-monooxygenase [Niveibacterium microcysteis]
MQRVIRLKRYAYALFLIPLVLPPAGLMLGAHYAVPDWGAWLTVLVVFGLVPLLDTCLGRDTANPGPDEERALLADPWYPALTLLAVPAWSALLVWGVWAVSQATLGLAGRVGLLASLATVGGAVAINVGHELIHKTRRAERAAGGWLLASVGYGGFKIEHIRGHHVDVATPRDTSTARLGENVYRFLWRAFTTNPVRAWELERARLSRRNLPWWRNELLLWWGLSLAWAVGFALWLGAPGLVAYLGIGVGAIALLEIVNYLEHYGLIRAPLPNGRYGPVTEHHSWNSPFLLTNLLLFQLQRHSDHHAHAARRYQILRHMAAAPQLPAGYAALVLLALVPPLWRRVMDPRVAAWRAQQGLA